MFVGQQATTVDPARELAMTDQGDGLSLDELLQRVDALESEVSKRKELEKQLRASEGWYEALEQLSPVGIFRTDPEGRCEYVNRRWSEIAGLALEDAKGEGWMRRLHPEDRDRVVSGWYEAAAKKERFHAEYRFLTPEGKVTWVIGDATAVCGRDGDLLGYVGTIADITDRKRTECALGERVKELTCLYSLSRVLSGAELKREEILREVVTILPPAFQYPEIAAARVVLQDQEQMSPGFPETGWRLAREIAVGGRPVGIVEVGYIEERPPAWEGPFLREEGRLIDEVALRLAEAVERMKTQEDEALIEELGAKEKQLEQFAYTVSHDLKSPLVTVRGYINLIKRAVRAGRYESLEAYGDRAAESADRLARRIEEMLALARAGRQLGPRQKIDFDRLAREALDMVQGRLSGRGVEVEIAPGLPVVQGDPARLREALENLLDNASKFMGAQPKPCIRIGARRDRDEDVLFVQDNGEGIARESQQEVFGLFTQIARSGEGIGAGLAIAKRIVEAHGGRIWVESEGPGQGCTFCFTLGAAVD
jgi:PAS domain S-box-containing protein